MNKILLILALVLFTSLVSAQVVTSDPNFYGSRTGTASFVNYGSSFSSYYGADANNYWPVLSNRDECTANQDVIIQVSPVGCQPTVVRSDLLAEQNVPVFCQLDLLQLNPVIDIKQIRNIRFNGRYPEYVAGVGFHPANAALRTTNSLLGTPLQSNIGYVVVVLKRNPDEKTVPEFFNFTLSASVDYYSGNSMGIGATEMLIKETNDEEWELAKNRQTLFGGKMSVRIKPNDGNSSINIGIYSGDVKYTELTLNKNQQQPTPVYLPGTYCQTALQFSYNDFVSPSLIARVRVDDDILDLYEGSRFLNNKCAVRRVSGNPISGEVELNCGNERVILNNSIAVLKEGNKVWKVGKDFVIDTSKEFTISKIIRDSKGVSYQLDDNGEPLLSGFVRPVSSSLLQDANYGGYESYLINATLDYEGIADSYGNEQKEIGKTYGELALSRAIRLNLKYDKKTESVRLINKYLQTYPKGYDSLEFSKSLNDLYERDSNLAGKVVKTDDGTHIIRLIDVSGSGKRSSALISWGAESKVIEQGTDAFFSFGNISLTNIKDYETVELKVKCSGNDRRNDFSDSLSASSSARACGQTIRVSQIDFQNYVKLRISPVTRSGSSSNFSVGIGIEKRAIELTPSKAKKKIENLNKSIQRWQSISNKLGDVVTTLKTACFATAGVLTVKNFFTGLSGEALARRGAMSGENGWTNICQNAVNAHNYSSLTECYNANSQKIASDVEARKNAIEQTNTVTKNIEKAHPQGDNSFDDLAARSDLINKIRSECGDVDLGSRSRDKTYSNVSQLVPQNANATVYSYTQLRDIYFNCKVIQNSGSTTEGKSKASTDLDLLGSVVGENLNYQKTLNNYNGAQIYVVNSRNTGNYYGETIGSLKQKGFTDNNNLGDSTYAQVVKGKDGKNYLATLNKQSDGYTVINGGVYSLDGADSKIISGSVQNSGEILDGVGKFTEVNSARYNNQFSPGENVVKYFETEPYKGRPAIVPFDMNKGFYAATSQALPFGGTKSFEENGRPASFYVCNIMSNKRVDFYSPNYGDDECMQFNIYTGQSYSAFPGLSESDSRRLIQEAIKAINEASEQYGKKSVRVGTNTLNVGSAAALLPGSQCQDFMSPDECKLLFNVCDPVICPVSRCNFGGSYYVSDVIQSGIVGSALLCLPNAKEGIVAPVCLTGIKAGIDGYLSVLKSHQQCLQEAVDTGKYVGICDQVTSVYMCEFFWRQAAPLAKTLIPKLVEQLYNGGQGGVRGGGEYMTVASSWQNAQDSVNYFTQSYAVNSFEAFRVRSLEEAGTEICRAFVSTKIPNSFETLVEPDSPPQFHAWFSAIDYTDATFPATSQYKVFYHIFAGNDRGVSYSVYLKDPPASSQYSTNPIVAVSTGFVARGQYATESKDFTAPKGYQQLCVRINDKEECGFKQVSSSFALDYVKDKIVSDEIKNNDVTTESECVSGGVNPSALLNTNVGSIAEEALNPAIYNRGVVRVCATENPASSTNPSRFVEVGYCGSQRLKCWLDKNSVDRAITESNKGLRSETLSELTQIQKENLESQKSLSPSDLASDINNLGKEVDSADSSKINTLLPKINALMDKAFWNSDKAGVLFLRARLFENVFDKSIKKIEIKGTVSSTSPSSSTTSSSSTGTNVHSSSDSGSTPTGKRILSFDGAYNERDEFQIKLDGEPTNIYLQGSRITYGEQRTIFGSVSNGKVRFLDGSRNIVDNTFGLGMYTFLNNRLWVENIKGKCDLDILAVTTGSVTVSCLNIPGCNTQTECVNTYGGSLEDYYCPGDMCYPEEIESSISVPTTTNSQTKTLGIERVNGNELRYLLVDGKRTDPAIYLDDNLLKKDVWFTDPQVGYFVSLPYGQLVIDSDHKDDFEAAFVSGIYNKLNAKGFTIKDIENGIDLNNIPDIYSRRFIIFEKYDSGGNSYLLYNGRRTRVYLRGNDFYDGSNILDRIGNLDASGTIKFFFENKVDSELGQGAYKIFNESSVSLTELRNGIDLNNYK